MKNFKRLLLSVTAALCLGGGLIAQSYDYPFQNPNLSDDERIENLLSLMTLEEKIATFSGLGVPRLGVANPGSSEAIHGLVRGGSTDLESFVRLSQLEREMPASPDSGNQYGPHIGYSHHLVLSKYLREQVFVQKCRPTSMPTVQTKDVLKFSSSLHI